MNIIVNSNNNLYSTSAVKTVLSPFDDKKYILDDRITIYTYKLS